MTIALPDLQVLIFIKLKLFRHLKHKTERRKSGTEERGLQATSSVGPFE